MTESLGLAVMTELPCVVIDVQRAGPSMGVPTKTEQADLLLAMFGRNGECPLPVLAPASPSDCFVIAHEAVRLAVRYMTPVVVLSDGYLAGASESWRIPDLADLPPLLRPLHGNVDVAGFMPYQRDDRLVRPWAVPGSPGFEHRTGGLEKEDQTGNVNYDPLNHEWMVQMRARKIAQIADDIPKLTTDGADDAELLVVGWGSTYGVIQAAVRHARQKGLNVASAHLRYLNPFPANTGDVLRRYRKILVPELNSGQLLLLLRSQFLVDAVGLHKIQGRPFHVREIERKIESLLS
jgi:2-oxoglutarate ferredoxin oxidoreductase subunit alpha